LTIISFYAKEWLRSSIREVAVLAPTNATVLISGETGAGKQVIAPAIHELSPRRNRNLVRVRLSVVRAATCYVTIFVVKIMVSLPNDPWR